MDIEWNIGNTILQRIEGVNVTFTANDFVIYGNNYTILQVSTSDDGRIYQCKVIINTSPKLIHIENITLDLTGNNIQMVYIILKHLGFILLLFSS